MKNKGIIIFLILLAVVIVAVIVGDYVSNRPYKSEANPYEFNVDEFRKVDPSLISYTETKNFNPGFTELGGISIYKGRIYVAGDKELKIIDLSGNLLLEINLPGKPQTVESTNGRIYLVVDNRVLVYDVTGNLMKEWEYPGENSILTSVAAIDSLVFVADAGNRRILKYNPEGELLGQFEGKSGDDVLHGFIIPSPYFDIDINIYGDLWVANPGMHTMENYTYDGRLREFWEKIGINIDGFSGCCNPAHFTFLKDGRFVTSEKGLVRVKVYKPSGDLDGVVAAPEKFINDGHAPDVATDSLLNVYALDYDKKMVRVFEPKQKTP